MGNVQLRYSTFSPGACLALLLLLIWQALPLGAASAYIDGAPRRAPAVYAFSQAPALAAHSGHTHCAGESYGCVECQPLPSRAAALPCAAARSGWPAFSPSQPPKIAYRPPHRPPRA